MGIDAVISVIRVQDEVKSFRVIPVRLFIPVLFCRLELRHEHLGHFSRGFGRGGTCLDFMMPVAAEAYSAGARARGDLEGVIDACSTGTWYSGLDLYDIGTSIGVNNVLHRVLDECWPLPPGPVVTRVLDTNETTVRMPIKWGASEQVFNSAMAKQGLGIAVHVIFRRHGKWP